MSFFNLCNYDEALGMEKRLHTVQIAGVPLKLKSSHDSEMVNSLVEIVDKKVKETIESHPTVSFQNALMMTALNLAEELELTKKIARRELDAIEDEAQQILSDLELSPVIQNNLDH